MVSRIRCALVWFDTAVHFTVTNTITLGTPRNLSYAQFDMAVDCAVTHTITDEKYQDADARLPVRSFLKSSFRAVALDPFCTGELMGASCQKLGLPAAKYLSANRGNFSIVFGSLSLCHTNRFGLRRLAGLPVSFVESEMSVQPASLNIAYLQVVTKSSHQWKHCPYARNSDYTLK